MLRLASGDSSERNAGVTVNVNGTRINSDSLDFVLLMTDSRNARASVKRDLWTDGMVVERQSYCGGKLSS